LVPAVVDAATPVPVIAAGGIGDARGVAAVLALGAQAAWLGTRPEEGDVIAHFDSGESIVRYEPAPPMAGTTGEIEALSMWAGQSVALARHLQSAADIVTELTSHL
jgi:NAD(P)H-dependent flavin oxidoreductase YrpB (nitropropane dioxygenase family)